MGTEIRKRLRWVELFHRLANYSVVCLKCGISRPTLRKWVGRYREHGTAGLASTSRKPKSSRQQNFLSNTVDGFAICAVVGCARGEFRANSNGSTTSICRGP